MYARTAYGHGHRALIVGAGPAGTAAAEELRRTGFAGELMMLCEEAPYDRPACSKGLITGNQVPRDAARKLTTTDLTWKLGRRAVALDPVAHVVTAHTGETFFYDGLVIATGTRSVLPTGWPLGEPGLHMLHTLEDAWAVRQDLRNAQRVAIVGGGLTGCELACSVVHMAREAILIDSGRTVMRRAIGEPLGALITDAHRKHGVQMRLGRRVQDVRRHRSGWRLTLSDGEELDTDVVVVTAGEVPDTEWLASSGLDISDGVLCDAALRAVGVEGVVAAGVLARWPNLRYGPKPVRVGQWVAALEQGRAAARALIAGNRPVPPFTLLPRFWSQQQGLRIQVCGQIDDRDAEVSMTYLRPGRASARGGALAGYYRDGSLVGLAAVNAPHAFTATARTLLVSVPPDSLSLEIPVAAPRPIAAPPTPAAVHATQVPVGQHSLRGPAPALPAAASYQVPTWTTAGASVPTQVAAPIPIPLQGGAPDDTGWWRTGETAQMPHPMSQPMSQPLSQPTGEWHTGQTARVPEEHVDETAPDWNTAEWERKARWMTGEWERADEPTGSHRRVDPSTDPPRVRDRW